jgi:3-hydroxypropanoate dehydrogenase
MSEGNRDKTASAPAVAVLALDTQFHEHIPTVLPFKPELRDVFAANDEMRSSTGQFSAAMQAGYSS